MTVGDFIEEIHGRAGDALRAAAWYDGDEIGLLYVREDLGRREVRERIGALYEQFAWTWTPREPASLEALGDVTATVQIRDRAAVSHVPLADRQGLIVSIAAEAADDLRGLVAERAGDLDETGIALRGGGRGEGEIKRCPHCGSRNYEVKSSRPGRPRKGGGEYRCRYCGEAFDTPVLAESRLDVLEGE